MVGIVGYGAYLPRYRIKAEVIAQQWGSDPDAIKRGLQLYEKTVPGQDEDTITISVAAARDAVRRAQIDPKEIGAVYIGSESHPYAVKPSGTILIDALGIGPHAHVASYEFACKAGTEAVQAAIGFVGSGMARYALSIGMDTAQGRPGDALEYTAGAGGAALLLGPAQESLAIFEGSYSYSTDTPDFWRRANEKYPEHGERFTGEPAYFKHVTAAAESIMESLGTTAADYRFAVFHQPNAKFPKRAGQILGFTPAQLETGLKVSKIGNTYSGASPIGLAGVLDIAKPGQLILMVSYGSGSGSDAFIWETTDEITAAQHLGVATTDAIINHRLQYITYGEYLRNRSMIVMGN